jgi:hypothetical protein
LREKCRLRVFENRVLRRIFGPEMDEVTRTWRRLHSKELNALYSSPNSIHAIKQRTLGWTGRVACIRARRRAYRVYWGKLREGDHLKDPGIDKRIILKWIFKK